MSATASATAQITVRSTALSMQTLRVGKPDKRDTFQILTQTNIQTFRLDRAVGWRREIRRVCLTGEFLLECQKEDDYQKFFVP